MTADLIIRLGPIIGGMVLMMICAVAILRNPDVSNVFAGLLAFAALLFVIPALAFFNFKGLGIEFSGQAATTGQVTEQAAGINARLEDIKSSIVELGKRIAPTAPAPPPPSADYGANRNSTIVVVYSADQKAKTLAKQMESALLKKGYQATSVYSDYSELGDARKGQPGSIRYVYTDAAKPVVNAVKQLLSPETSGLTTLPDDPRQQMSADVQVLLF